MLVRAIKRACYAFGNVACRVASDKAYARCCANACNATRTMDEFNALAPDEVANSECNAISESSEAILAIQVQ